MDFAEEAKSLWPISSVFSAPLLVSDDDSDTDSRKIGPLFFNPSPQTLTQITLSPSLYSPPHSFSPSPRLSLSRFLETTTDASILPSTCSSLANFTLGPQDSPTPLAYNNSLEMIKCSGSGRVLLFFPAGQNLDQVGFVLLLVEGGQVGVKYSGASSGLNHRILRLLVQKVDDRESGDFGFLLILTMYSVSWYAVRLGLDSDKPKLEFLGTKCFRTCATVHACWSPHLPEECLVLLESGKLFLFDLESCYLGSDSLIINKFKEKSLKVPWDDHLGGLGKGSWLSCEFSWHPRILVVTHSRAVFLVDLRAEGCQVKCLLSISMLAGDSFVQKNDQFVVFSRTGPDQFHYTVASNSFLFLCDVRKPLKPVLQWNHGIDNPAYITGVKLSKLRSNSKNDECKWATEHGYCILMGSFWNCEFSLFCYGPNPRKYAEISSLCKSFYAWKLPSELSLAACDCYCGSCLLREEFLKDDLPEWIDGQQKNDIVLGFCILDEDPSLQLFEPENYGSFTVIRLMSSGHLELQRYFASHGAVNFYEKAHKEIPILLKEFLICRTGDEEYKFSKQLYTLNLDYLYGHLSDKLDKVLMNKKKETSDDKLDKVLMNKKKETSDDKLDKVLMNKTKKTSGNGPEVSSSSGFHQDICQKLKARGINKFRAATDIRYVVGDIVCPMSILEIAVMSMWSSLPPVLLRLSLDLCTNSVGPKNFSFPSLSVPDQSQLSPRKMQHGNALMGPAVPLHFLVTFNKLHIETEADGQSANRLVETECNKVKDLVNKEDLRNGSQDGDRFSIYEPVAFSSKISKVDPPKSASSSNKNHNYSTFVSRCSSTKVYSSGKGEPLKPEAIDAVCDSGVKFRDLGIDHLPAEFKYFLGQQKKFKNSFTAKRSSFRKRNL